jgi:haloalkane dehalogenase
MAISSEDPFPRSRIPVKDAEMASVDVIPHLRDLGRCIAPDLIGMGESAKLPDPGPGTYGFETHAAYLDAFLEEVQLDGPAVLILHDWGSALGFDWARRHPDQVRGIAFFEAIVNPFTWADWPEISRRIFRAMRGPDGEDLVIDQNVFVERLLPASVLHGLAPEALDRYRRPFLERQDRWPTLEWPRQIPIENVPPKLHDVVDAYARWLRASDVPKLFVNAEPGFLQVGRMRRLVRRWPALTEVTVSAGHFVPEDCPDQLGIALADWVRRLG